MSLSDFLNKELLVYEIFDPNINQPISIATKMTITQSGSDYSVTSSYGNSFFGEIQIENNFISKKDQNSTFSETRKRISKEEIGILRNLQAPFYKGTICFLSEKEIHFSTNNIWYNNVIVKCKI